MVFARKDTQNERKTEKKEDIFCRSAGFLLNLPRKIREIANMKHKIQVLLLAILLPVFCAVAQNTTQQPDGNTGATQVDGNTGATKTNKNAADNSNAAPTAEDSVVVNLLTCSPGDLIHRLYGHTALRVITPEEDWAVNYGWFSFNTPNFIMKFILGLTDYSMAYQTMPIFLMDFMRDDMGVTEQQLNLTPAEAKHVKEALYKTLQSEGSDRHDYNLQDPTTGQRKQESIIAARWTYRYNFLYDNCTTRAVDAIKEALKANGETLVYPSLAANQETTTQRKMIHEFTTNSPWFEFGQDLLLGPEVDEEHTMQELLDGLNFLPTYAQNFFQEAQIKGKDGKMRPLVTETSNLTPFLVPQERHPAFPLSPSVVMGIIAAVAVLISFSQRKAEQKAAAAGTKTPAQHAWRIWGNAFDFTCWTAQGIVGILLVIMVGWSEHPAVGTNWLLLIFNPLFFLGIPARLMSKKFDFGFACFSLVMAIAMLVVYLAGVQQIPVGVVIFLAAIAARALVVIGKPKSALQQ